MLKKVAKTCYLLQLVIHHKAILPFATENYWETLLPFEAKNVYLLQLKMFSNKILPFGAENV